MYKNVEHNEKLIPLGIKVDKPKSFKARKQKFSIFHWIGPLGRFCRVVAMSVHMLWVCMYVCVSCPLSMQFFFIKLSAPPQKKKNRFISVLNINKTAKIINFHFIFLFLLWQVFNPVLWCNWAYFSNSDLRQKEIPLMHRGLLELPAQEDPLTTDDKGLNVNHWDKINSLKKTLISFLHLIIF